MSSNSSEDRLTPSNSGGDSTPFDNSDGYSLSASGDDSIMFPASDVLSSPGGGGGTDDDYEVRSLDSRNDGNMNGDFDPDLNAMDLDEAYLHS